MPDLAVVFEPVGEAELASYLDATRLEFLGELVAMGVLEDDAALHADATVERVYPGGSLASGHLIGRVVGTDGPVGVLWIGPAGADRRRWYVYDIAIDEQWRGKGYGRQAMLLAEKIAREHGASAIGLNVFARNTVARNLYTSLGYVEGSIQMNKGL